MNFLPEASRIVVETQLKFLPVSRSAWRFLILPFFLFPAVLQSWENQHFSDCDWIQKTNFNIILVLSFVSAVVHTTHRHVLHQKPAASLPSARKGFLLGPKSWSFRRATTFTPLGSTLWAVTTRFHRWECNVAHKNTGATVLPHGSCLSHPPTYRLLWGDEWCQPLHCEAGRRPLWATRDHGQNTGRRDYPDRGSTWGEAGRAWIHQPAVFKEIFAPQRRRQWQNYKQSDIRWCLDCDSTKEAAKSSDRCIRCHSDPRDSRYRRADPAHHITALIFTVTCNFACLILDSYISSPKRSRKTAPIYPFAKCRLHDGVYYNFFFVCLKGHVKTCTISLSADDFRSLRRRRRYRSA